MIGEKGGVSRCGFFVWACDGRRRRSALTELPVLTVTWISRIAKLFGISPNLPRCSHAGSDAEGVAGLTEVFEILHPVAGAAPQAASPPIRAVP